MKKFGFYFAELSVTTGVYLLLIYYIASKKYIFSPSNREISWLMLLFFGIGIAMVIYHLCNLYKENQQLVGFLAQVESFRGTTQQLLQRKYTAAPERIPQDLRSLVDEHFGALKPSLLKERIYKIFNMTVTTPTPNYNTLSNLLQRKIEVRGKRIRYIAGFLLMIGLLGTFLSLHLEGVNQAFGTSLVGLAGGLVLGYLSLVVQTKQTHIIYQIEEVTLAHLIPAMQEFQAEKTRDLAANTIDILRTLPATVSEQLRAALERIMQQTIGRSTENLTTTSIHLENAAKNLQEGQDRYINALNAFEDFLVTFQKDKKDLLTGQETLASYIQELSQITTVNRQVFEKLSETLQNEHTTFIQSIQHLEEFLNTAKAESLGDFERIQGDIKAIMSENKQITRELLESHTMLTTLLHNMKTFVLDEQRGLHALSAGLEEIFEETRSQHLQLVEYLEEAYKQLYHRQE